MSKIEHLPGTRLTPTVVLARNLDIIEDHVAVVVVAQDADGSWRMDWSQMSYEKLAMALVYLQHRIQNIVMGLDESVEVVKGKGA